MALTESKEAILGEQAPSLSLLNVNTNMIEPLENHMGSKGTIVVFMCNHCPYVIHLLDHFVALAHRNNAQGVKTIAISSNDPENYPDDSPSNMKALSKNKGFNFPYFYDETQQTALGYGAVCTPDFYLLNHNKEFVYRGRYDSSRPGNNLPLSGDDLQGAIDVLIKDQTVIAPQHPGIGCSIKWKTENKPSEKFI